MGDLSNNFNRSEFACKCGCGFDTVDAGLIDALEEVRDHFNAAVIVTSGCRCPKHNASVGGAADSQHLYGRAADIVVTGEDSFTVYMFLVSLAALSMGRYPGWVHIDTRSGDIKRWYKNEA